jgi:hypothetical protein
MDGLVRGAISLIRSGRGGEFSRGMETCSSWLFPCLFALDADDNFVHRRKRTRRLDLAHLETGAASYFC